MDQDEPLLKVSQVARMLNVSEITIRRRRAELGWLRLASGHLRFRLSAVRKFREHHAAAVVGGGLGVQNRGRRG